MAGIPFGSFGIDLTLDEESTRKALSRIISAHKIRWRDKVARNHALIGQTVGATFHFSKVEPGSPVLRLEYKGEIIPTESGCTLKVRCFLKIPGMVILGLLFAGLAYMSRTAILHPLGGAANAKFFVAPLLLGLSLLWFNSFFLAREERLRTRINLRERIENMQAEKEKPKYESDGIFD